jgi:AAA15 family ATPase/GTPase
MEMIKNLQINNYKSIKQLNLSCSRINVFVGRPNVGKSNILEALDLSFLSCMMGLNNTLEKANKKPKKRPGALDYDLINIKQFFRVDTVSNLFHMGDISQPISVKYFGAYRDDILHYMPENKSYGIGNDKEVFMTEFDDDFSPTLRTKFAEAYFPSPVYPYRYKSDVQFHDEAKYMNKLMPPYGNNLIEVIEGNPGFRNFIDQLAQDSGIEFNVDKGNRKISIQLRVKKGLVYTIPYHALADTLRRVLFYIAAVRTGDLARVITLEEPEAHSFPPYVSVIADEIIEKASTQFFVATHSPYLLHNLIENTPTEDLKVFVCGYDKEKFQTSAKELSQTDLSELLDYGVDIFFNLNRYLDDRVEHNS